MTNQVITATQSNAESVINYATGTLVGDANTPVAYTLPVGFKPRYALLVCIASSVSNNVGRQIEWFDGMADSNAIVTTLATGSGSAASKSVSTTLGPVIAGTTPNNGELRSVTWPAGAFDASATYCYQIEG